MLSKLTLVGGGAALLSFAGLHFQLKGDNSLFDKEILDDKDYKFMEYIVKHGKSYATKSEFHQRQTIFKQKLMEIEEWNGSNQTSKIGLNHLSDRTFEEIDSLKSMISPSDLTGNMVGLQNVQDLPDSVDWRETGAAGEVHYQGNENESYHFPLIDSIQGAEFIKKGGEMKYLSIQQIIECADDTKSLVKAQAYIVKNGLETTDDYPLRQNPGKCHYDKSKVSTKVRHFGFVEYGNINALKTAISLGLPVVGVDASSKAFQDYKSGIISTAQCGTQINHHVLAAGYGKDEETGMEYFLLKNSWGSNYGDHGYLKVQASKDNVCGVLNGWLPLLE